MVTTEATDQNLKMAALFMELSTAAAVVAPHIPRFGFQSDLSFITACEIPNTTLATVMPTLVEKTDALKQTTYLLCATYLSLEGTLEDPAHFTAAAEDILAGKYQSTTTLLDVYADYENSIAMSIAEKGQNGKSHNGLSIETATDKLRDQVIAARQTIAKRVEQMHRNRFAWPTYIGSIAKITHVLQNTVTEMKNNRLIKPEEETSTDGALLYSELSAIKVLIAHEMGRPPKDIKKILKQVDAIYAELLEAPTA